MAAASGRKQDSREPLKRLGGVETEKSQSYLYNEERPDGGRGGRGEEILFLL